MARTQDENYQINERLTTSQKNKNNKKWYRDYADRLDASHVELAFRYGDISEYRRMKVNYDLYNNKIDLADFSYVMQPFGANVGELPARMVNRDIVAGKINAMLGMKMKRGLTFTPVATNPEATTRKEQTETSLIKDFVISQIMQPIREQKEMQAMSEIEGRDLTPDEIAELQERVAQEVEAMTPDEVKKYMQREHQDPAEVMTSQLLEYLIRKLDIKRKFDLMFKHGLLSALGIMYVGVLNGEPQAWNVNSMRFDCEKSSDIMFTEDAENASCEYRMTPSQILQFFGDELTDKQIDKIYKQSHTIGSKRVMNWLENDTMYPNDYLYVEDNNSIRVLHTVWKALREIGFLTYIDENGEEQTKLVDETYKLNPEIGDLQIEWEWIPEVYETWKIEDDIYVNMRPLPGQFKDIDNVYECKLPYYGIIYDNINSARVSLMDRMKSYQYYYNILWYKLELLLASDKGKKVLMNINMIPDDENIDLQKWQYFFESTPFMWYNPDEEGDTGKYNDANTVAKQIDLSLVSDINKYIEVAEYVRQQCGRAVGITDQVEGQISPNEAVGNTRQNLVQTSYIIEPYFNLQAAAERNILQALIEAAKVAYSGSGKKKLSYVLDDMTQVMFELDTELLDNSTLGIFMSDSTRTAEARELLIQLAQSALQNQKVELSDVISIVKQEGIVEAEETLKLAEEKRRQFEMQMQQEQMQAQAEENERGREFLREQHEMEKELIVLKEEERRKTEIVKNAILGASFNPEADNDNDGKNDFLEMAESQADINIQNSKLSLEQRKFEHQRDVDKQKLENDKKKIEIQGRKSNKK